MLLLLQKNVPPPKTQQQNTLDVLTRVFIIIESRRRNRIEKERNEYLVHT